MPTELDRKEIEAILPHRDPFLFVEAITEIEPGSRIVGRLNGRRMRHYAPRDRDSGYLPPTVLTEAMAQVGAILVLYPEENRGRTIYFRSIEKTSFERQVPSDADVQIEAKVRRMRSRFGSLSVTARTDSEDVAAGVMSFALG